MTKEMEKTERGKAFEEVGRGSLGSFMEKLVIKWNVKEWIEISQAFPAEETAWEKA